MTKEHSERPEFEGPPANAAAEGQIPGGPQAPAGSQAAEGAAGQVDDLAGLSVEELQARVRQTREDAQRNWQHFLHSAADLENYKKQAVRERQDAVERTRRQMLSLVLGVIDNLERALAYDDGQRAAAGRGPAKALLDGLRMTHRQILDQLAAVGVRPIETLGKPFDPRLHEAIGVVPAHDDRQAAGTVAGEALKGYLLNDDVLRPAKVTVVAERQPDRPANGSQDGV